MNPKITTLINEVISEHMRELGRKTSASKAIASRRNGKKGGRPKKQKVDDK